MASVWGELKRRNVVKVAAAYAIVAWLLIRIIVSVEEPLNLPGSTDTFIIVLLAVGFVVTLLVAWAYELTPDGIKRTRLTSPSGAFSRVSGRKLDFIIIGLMAMAITFLVVDNYWLEDSLDGGMANNVAETPAEGDVGETAVLPNSAAVLPFENLSLDPEDAFFAAGIHEEILNHS